MRTPFLYFIGGSLASLAIPTSAQDAPATPPAAPVEPAMAEPDEEGLTPEQMMAYGTWPAERQVAYEAWPADVKAYFWSLPAARQDLFWRLTDEDKLAVAAMTEENRTAAWGVIEEQAEAHADQAEPDAITPEEPKAERPPTPEPDAGMEPDMEDEPLRR